EAREAVPQARQLVDRAALRRERHGAMLYRSTGPGKRPGTTKRPRRGRTGGVVSGCPWRYARSPARRRAARALLRAPVLRWRPARRAGRRGRAVAGGAVPTIRAVSTEPTTASAGAGEPPPSPERPQTSRRRGVASNTAIFSIATGLSRIAGLVREIVASSYFA